MKTTQLRTCIRRGLITLALLVLALAGGKAVASWNRRRSEENRRLLPLGGTQDRGRAV